MQTSGPPPRKDPSTDWRSLPAPARIAALLFVPILTLVLVALEWNGIPGQYRDTFAYYQAAEAARNGGARLYTPEAMTAGPHEYIGLFPYLYPPPLAALLSFLPRSSYATFDRAWLVVNLICFWLLAIALARLATGGFSVPGVVKWGTALFLLPGAVFSIRLGNIDLFIVMLLAWALLLVRQGGVILGFAAVFKVTPVWPLMVLLVRRPGATAAGAALALVLCGVASLLAFGSAGAVQLSMQWVSAVMPTLSQGQFWAGSLAGIRRGELAFLDYLDNLSLSFLPVQLAVLLGWDYRGGPLPGAVRVYLTAASVGVPLLTAWLTRRRTVYMQAASVAAAAMLAAPITRPIIFPTLLIVLAALHRERRERVGIQQPH